jgi:hypothetical protein
MLALACLLLLAAIRFASSGLPCSNIGRRYQPQVVSDIGGSLVEMLSSAFCVASGPFATASVCGWAVGLLWALNEDGLQAESGC